MRNIELLEETMQYIKDHPTQHDQRMYVYYGEGCGTTACFAGRAAMLSGWNVFQVEACDPDLDIGKYLLGLTWGESRALFYADNTVDELEVMVKELVAGNTIRHKVDMPLGQNPPF